MRGFRPTPGAEAPPQLVYNYIWRFDADKSRYILHLPQLNDYGED